MTTYFLMAIIMLFLAGTIIINASLQPDSEHFFDKDNCNSLRGFWSLIVMLVHIPVAYQNRIQDMIGSFAYIGVTFFFMASAYGLKLNAAQNPNGINRFWTRRLPKLIIPCILVNIVSLAVSLCGGGKNSIWNQ
jgi:peptidoglycan/LPS O-acetylase OafA/YrhL